MAQTNPVVGDIAGNAKKILSWTAKAKRAGAQLVLFPELTVTGYPPEDLLLKPGFIDDNLKAKGWRGSSAPRSRSAGILRP